MLLTEDPPVDLPTPSGPMRTYSYRPLPPAGTTTPVQRWPGLVVYSEIFQRTPPIHRMAMMLAGHGFVVAVSEIFHELEPPGTVLAYDTAGAERGNRHKLGKSIAVFDADARPCSTGSRPHRIVPASSARWASASAVTSRFAPRSSPTSSPPRVSTRLTYKASLGSAGDDSLARQRDHRRVPAR
jgi:hypothetical protein